MLRTVMVSSVPASMGLGGSGGSTVVSEVLRSLPVGVPKLLVSTLASGDVRTFVGTSDLTLVTVIATEGWRAEIMAKAVLLRGSEHPFDLLGGTGVQADLRKALEWYVRAGRQGDLAAQLKAQDLARRVDATR